jgi:dihydrofolate reductase
MQEFSEIFKLFDTVLMGRKTYDHAYASTQNQDTSQSAPVSWA